MENNTRLTGNTYEDMAAKYILSQNMTILSRNYNSGHGEIDIVADDCGCLVFFEVKFRKNARYGFPEEAVDFRKQKHLRYAAAHYMAKYKIMNTPVRFDVIAILGNELKHIKNAF